MRTQVRRGAPYLGCRRALGVPGEAAPPRAFWSQRPPEELITVGERSAWGVHKLALMLREEEGPCETSGIYSEGACPALTL